MDRPDPRTIRELPVEADLWSGDRARLTLRVRPGGSDAEARACLVHQIGHLELWGSAGLDPGEADRIRPRDDPFSALGGNRDALPLDRLPNPPHRRRPKAPTPET